MTLPGLLGEVAWSICARACGQAVLCRAMAGRWDRPLRRGARDLTEEGPPGGGVPLGGEGPTGGEGPELHAGARDLSVAEARVEIRALWARVHELELEIQQLRHHLSAAILQIQIHG